MAVLCKKWLECIAAQPPFAHSRPVMRRRRSLEALIAATPTFERQPGWLDEDVGREREAFGE